jgi:hypothetical protein
LNIVTNYVADVAERAVKTAAQSALTYLTMNNVIGPVFNAHTLDYGMLADFAMGGAIFSILTSLVSQPFGDKLTASVIKGQGDTVAQDVPNSPALESLKPVDTPPAPPAPIPPVPDYAVPPAQ